MQTYTATIGVYGLVPLTNLEQYKRDHGITPSRELYQAPFLCQLGLTDIVLGDLRKNVVTSLSREGFKPLREPVENVKGEFRYSYGNGIMAVFQNMTLQGENVLHHLAECPWLSGKEKASKALAGLPPSEPFYILGVKAMSAAGLKPWAMSLESVIRSLPISERTNLSQLILALSSERVL